MGSIAEVEAQLVEAWRTGDLENGRRLEAELDRLQAEADARKAAVTLHSAALWYASVGLRVFPLSPGTKIPFKGSNGCNDASTNVDVTNGWWDRDPDANIGLATGHLVDVVDIDGLPGQQSRTQHWCYDETCKQAGSLPQPPADWTPLCDHDGVFNRIERDHIAKVTTPRPGGMHLFVPATGDGNKAGIFPGVDYRGKGGYVVAPPSVISEEYARAHGCHAGRYSFLGTPRLTDLTRDGAA